jgi:hypothetical protein
MITHTFLPNSSSNLLGIERVPLRAEGLCRIITLVGSVLLVRLLSGRRKAQPLVIDVQLRDLIAILALAEARVAKIKIVVAAVEVVAS